MRVAALFVILLLFVFSVLLRPTSGAVVVPPLSVSFPFVPADFAPAIATEICGRLHVADPLDGCAPLLNRFEPNETGRSNFVVIARGGCYFTDKIRRAQNAGFASAIVYDNQADRDLINMGGSSNGININAVFVSKVAGEFLKLYAPVQEGDCCIVPHIADSNTSNTNTSDTHKSNKKHWGDIAIYTSGSITVLLAIIGIIVSCCWRSASSENIDSGSVELSPNGDTMTVETFPSFTFRAKETCAICLEDYKEGEIITVFPCKHGFHASCVASWLTRGTLCPVCRLDVGTRFTNSAASRTAPVSV